MCKATRIIEVPFKRNNQPVNVDRTEEEKRVFREMSVRFANLPVDEQSDEELDKIINYIEEHKFEYTVKNMEGSIIVAGSNTAGFN
jgi:hypothetical protein